MTKITSRPHVGLAGCILALILTLCVPSASAAFRYLQEGMPAPPVDGTDIVSDSTVSLEIPDGVGVTIVTFWATWSQRSLALLSDLKLLSEEYPDRPFTVIAVNVEAPSLSPQARAAIERVVDSLALPFPVILDDGLGLFYQYGVIAVPSTAILDSTNMLRYAPSGYSLTVRDRIADSIEVLLGLKEPTDAIAVRRGYVPRNTASRYYQLAVQLANQRLYERALVHLDSAEESDSNFSAPHNLRGQIMLRLDSVASALIEFAEAVQLDSMSVAAWAGWAHALFLDGNIQDAQAKASMALEIDGSYTPALLDLALCLFEQQHVAEALDSLRAARELNPIDPTVHYYMGRVLGDADSLSGAVSSYRSALEILFPSP